VFLYDTPHGYQRQDYCLACSPPAQPTPIARWRTRRSQPDERKPRTFDLQALCHLFEQLQETDQPQAAQFRFLLALLLWRKKILRLERTTTGNGRETWEFIMPHTGQSYQLLRPELDEARLDQLGQQLELVISGGSTEPGLVPGQEQADG